MIGSVGLILMPRRRNHHLHADELKRDIGHRRDDAGDGDRQRQRAVSEAAAHEIGSGDVALCFGDRPQPGKTMNSNG